MASRRWLRGQSDVMVSLSTPRPLTTLGASRSTGAFDEVRRVYGDFATALGGHPTVQPTAPDAGRRPCGSAGRCAGSRRTGRDREPEGSTADPHGSGADPAGAVPTAGR